MTREVPQIHGYHVHVYYDTATRPVASKLRETLAARFPVQAGDLHDEPVGPHPISQFAVIFQVEAFQAIVPWLMLHREGLDILIHPLTDDMVDDHTGHALWLGKPVSLKIGTLQRRGYGAALLPAV